MQYDVYKNANPTTRPRYPLLLDVQAELLSDLETRMVVPLAPAGPARDRTVSRLMPIIVLKGTSYLVLTNEMAGVPRGTLGEHVGNVTSFRADLIGALDLLFTGI